MIFSFFDGIFRCCRYVTGCCEGSSSFILYASGGRVQQTSLFIPRRSESQKIWEGGQESEEEMMRRYGVDEVENDWIGREKGSQIVTPSSFSNYISKLSSSSIVISQPHKFSYIPHSRMENVERHLDWLRLVRDYGIFEILIKLITGEIF